MILFDLRKKTEQKNKDESNNIEKKKMCGSEKIVDAKFSKWKQQIDSRKKAIKIKKNRNKTNNDHLLNGSSLSSC